MRTVVLGERPVELETVIERRRALGLDRFDEVWEGEYHMSPAPHPWHGVLDHRVAVAFDPYLAAVGLTATGPFNLGHGKDDYRVPDRALHRGLPSTTLVPTAALVVEIVSPDDESWAKLDFFSERGVDEVVIVDPVERRVSWLGRTDDGYVPITYSAVLEVAVDEVVDRIEFPGD